MQNERWHESSTSVHFSVRPPYHRARTILTSPNHARVGNVRLVPPDSPSRRQLSIQSKGRFGGKKPELMQLSLSCLYTDRFAAALHAECTPSPFNLSFPLLRCRGQSGSRVNTRVGTVVPPGALFPHRILHQVPSTRGSSPTSACFHRTYQVPCVI